jgi:hypothetical protein
MVEPHRVVDAGLFQVFQGSARTAADIGDTGARREAADLKRPLGEVTSSRPYARPRYVMDLLPVERTIDRHTVGSRGRSLVFKGLLSLGNLSCRQLFVYQYHATPRARRKMNGEDGLDILEPDRLNFHGHLAPIADPSTINAGLAALRHDPRPLFISILWE